MGSSVLSTDLLVNTYIKPALNAYVFGHYQTSATLLYTFNSFLTKFRGVGIDEMPPPPKLSESALDSDIRSRYKRTPTHFSNSKVYVDQWLPRVSAALGAYQDKILKAIANHEDF